MDIALTDDERRALGKALAHYLRELRGEIARTDDHDFRTALQREAQVLDGVVSRLGGAGAGV
jgi:hypothetical protein